MSSARKFGERRALDAYLTPTHLAEALVSLLPIQATDSVWEPHAGGGAFAEALRRRSADVFTSDVDPLVQGVDEHGDFLEMTRFPVDWVVGNPPFARPETRDGKPTGRLSEKTGKLIMEPAAQLHVEHALEQSRHVAFLMRLAMLESSSRVPFWKDVRLRKVWVLSQRPSFTGGKTDSTAYGFFWFDNKHFGTPSIDWLWSWR